MGGRCGLWPPPPPALSAGVMWLEIVLASVLGLVIYWFVSRDKEETLPLGDGWWGPGVRPPGGEDESIRHFKVETSDEEINVRPLLEPPRDRGWALGWGCGGNRPPVGVCFRLPFSHWGAARITHSPHPVPSPSHLSPPFPTRGRAAQLCHLLCAPPETWGGSL